MQNYNNAYVDNSFRFKWVDRWNPLEGIVYLKILSPIFVQTESKMQKCIFDLAIYIEKCKTQRIFSIEKCNIGSKHNMVIAKSFFQKHGIFQKYVCKL